MEFIRRADVTTLTNVGVASEQLLFPENSASRRVTITRVTLAPGARNPRHTHPSSEQAWVALRGNGQLLLEQGTTLPFAEGDVVRFADGDVHGFENTGAEEFVYLSVTSPPVNFRAAYAAAWQDKDHVAAGGEELDLFARFHARPGCAEAVLEAIRTVEGPTKQEPGCAGYRVFGSVRVPGEYWIHSRWRDRAAFDLHASLPHTVRFLDTVQPLIDHPLDVSLTAHLD